MTIESIALLKNSKKRLIGLDLGTKTIGVALSDLTWLIATPHSLIKRTKQTQDLKILKTLLKDYNVGAIILGLPVNMNGTEGPRAEASHAFKTVLEKAFPDILVMLWDERLSTAAVTRTLLDADLSRKRRDEVVDKMAATFILQGVLDRLRALSADHAMP